jgi:hypothetical protein
VGTPDFDLPAFSLILVVGAASLLAGAVVSHLGDLRKLAAFAEGSTDLGRAFLAPSGTAGLGSLYERTSPQRHKDH